jgi:hypothetical protein
MKQEPLMMDRLTPGKRAALAGLVQHPGWAVVEELHMDACKRATEDVLKANPEETGYDQLVKARQIKARERNEFSLLILKSVEWHIQAAQGQAEEEEAKAPQNPILKTGQPSKDNKQ